ncbi:gliding motility-associated C-terminal domain-containing protein [Mucilaginibacter sp. JRF]|uniref:gliding motility-associated C-terminal domain-containing protein n=1 Tax=Mucilaginibacter sp. JRF TaxID=2780088 RepID=UPI00187E6797|nr:gliding motility-associated C-terminal domain-containing protein [Mucilaginibacter sp. JRF]MBE9585038.1 gliding motility-associated C-terminal domain-containing protein [Mucilaginibacter sp. JRF]
MRRLALGFMCCLLLMFSAGHIKAQTCNGSLGDPVVSESFNQQGPLPNSQAQNIQYTADPCPQDGQYTVVRSYAPPCNQNNWHSVPGDHTGNGGYMIVVNASYTKSQFFEKRVSGLCGNTVYELSVYILDLMRKDIDGPGVIHPALRFLIEDGSGNVIRDTSIAIGSTAGPEFIKRGVMFATTPNSDEVILKIFNDADGGYGNDFILDDIAFRACGPQVSAAFTDIGEQDYAPECPSSGTKQYTMRATSSQTGYAYQWQQFINEEWQDIPGANANTYVANIDLSKGGKYEYRAGVAKAGNLGSEYCRVYSLPRTILIYEKPVLAPINDVTICRGSNATINLSGGVRYLINGPDGLRVETSNSQYTFQQPDPPQGWGYTAYAYSADGCMSEPRTFRIIVKPPFTTTVTANTDTICDGQFVQLEATNNIADDYTYSWSPAAGLSATDVADPVASPQKTTTYTVTVSNGACIDTKQVTITVLHPPAIELAERREMFEGTPIRFDPVYSGDITSYRWFPEEGLDDPTSANPLVVATEDMTYTVTATGPCAIAIATVSVRVYQKINIPNTFTPNGDGINDVWNIEDLATYPTSETLIFNRNGQQVFRSIGYTTPWDGRFNSSQLPAGTYYYIIDLKNNTPKVAGYVTLLR